LGGGCLGTIIVFFLLYWYWAIADLFKGKH
jgi:hypothetical protein